MSNTRFETHNIGGSKEVGATQLFIAFPNLPPTCAGVHDRSNVPNEIIYFAGKSISYFNTDK